MTKIPAVKRPKHDSSRRKARGLLAVGTSLPKLAAPVLRKRGFAQARLITDWPAIVGDLVARETVPQKLVFPRSSRDGATLHLRVTTGFALELQHIAPQIIQRINGFFGYRAVAELRFMQGPIPPLKKPRSVSSPRLSDVAEARLQRNLEGIDNDDLRQALAALGRAVSNRQAPDRESD
jgi:hypothetical protein